MDEESFLFGLVWIVFIIIGLFIYIRSRYRYFEGKKIPVPPQPCWPYGNFDEVCEGKTTFQEFILYHYRRFKRKRNDFGGVYLLFQPCIIVTNPELSEEILQDKEHFEITDFRQSLKNLKTYASLRNKIPFSSNFEEAILLSEDLKEELSQLLASKPSNENATEDLTFILNRYIVNVFAKSVFGVDEKQSTLVNLLEKLHTIVKHPTQSSKLFNSTLGVYYTPNIDVRTSPDVKSLFKTCFTEILIARDNTDKKSLLNKLLNLSENNEELIENIEELACDLLINETNLTRNIIIFSLYELSLDGNVQSTLRQEILLNREGKTINASDHAPEEQFPFLNAFSSEILRKYPLCPVFHGTCKKNYKNAKFNVEIEKNNFVFIPVFGIHHDTDHYSLPEQLDLTRFYKHSKNSIPDSNYMPFGISQNYLGGEFSKILLKAALMHLISRFRFTLLSDKTTNFISFKENPFFLTPNKEFKFRIEKI